MGASNAASTTVSNGYNWLKIVVLALVILVSGYSVIVMYATGEYAFAILTLLIVSLGVYVFTNSKTYAHRYIFPGVAGMVIFIIFPLAYTIGISFTNYSGSNLLSLERVQDYHLKQSYLAKGGNYDFSLIKTEQDRFKLVLRSELEPEKVFVSPTIKLWNADEIKSRKARPEDFPYVDSGIQMRAIEEIPEGEKATLRDVISLRTHLQSIYVTLPAGVELSMSGLRKFAALRPLFSRLSDGVVLENGTIISDPNTLRNNKSNQLVRPNYHTGFYQYIDANGEFVGDALPPGFTVSIGWNNYWRVFTDKGIQGPFLEIFVWTVMFAAGSVFFTLAIGLVLGNLVQWEFLGGKAIYRVILILPYAVPAFISILVFKGLFNQNFGEINMVLEALFGIKPDWYTTPSLARSMILIVNTWLGYPYMMILSMGLLKSIPEDLYEASAMDGAGPISNFFNITVPLLIKPLTPLLIASFAFNFNNFVLIALLTNGGPDIIGATTPAGTTDVLVSYTYRIAFEGSGQDYGLAAAIATVIFILVGAMAILNLKLTKMDKV
ncbi:maltose ABC transporter permease MalF [Corallincola spongiicola]|uniref:Maltose/maltodextrin transport system permease protein n=1 Tax=Corallincola spongiicola TaxID=2520508 RepID=A0ABY1WUA3_9GAMM|nr:maltose ABC transporter permease MalF [Corallincola spongiicola]TAA48313.1 maltose ABC transporter permease MalF [Corallincola spongiicola]